MVESIFMATMSMRYQSDYSLYENAGGRSSPLILLHPATGSSMAFRI